MNIMKIMKYRRNCLTSLFTVCLLTLSLLTSPASWQKAAIGTSQAASTEKNSPAADNSARKALIQENYGKLPLGFEANQGQTAPRVKYLSRGAGYTFFLTATEAVMELRRADAGLTSMGSAQNSLDAQAAPRTPQSAAQSTQQAATLRMKLIGANAQPRISGEDELPGKSNYFMGSDAKQWQTDVPNYARVKYEGVYPGIDVVYYGNQQQLEYDFIVAPGADPSRIKLNFAGAKQMRVDAEGDLVLQTKAGEVRQHKPVIYQEVNGARQPVAGRYAINKDLIGIEVGAYDASKPLVIDPVVSYATYLPATGGTGEAITVDAAGCAYVTGSAGLDFPTTTGALRVTAYEHPADQVTGGGLIYVAKLSTDGTRFLYSAVLGGTRGFPVPFPRGPRFAIDNRSAGIAIDAAGNAYVTGSTVSTNFPVTPGAIETSYDPTNPVDARAPLSAAFVLKLNATGSQILYSTLLGRGDAATAGIKVDAGGNAYITGFAGPGLRTTPGAYQRVNGRDRGISVGQTALDAFIAKLNPTGTALVYSTFIGGGADDRAYDIALDAEGNAYVTGITGNDYLGAGVLTTPFPTTRAPFETFTQGDCIIAKSKA